MQELRVQLALQSVCRVGKLYWQTAVECFWPVCFIFLTHFQQSNMNRYCGESSPSFDLWDENGGWGKVVCGSSEVGVESDFLREFV